MAQFASAFGGFARGLKTGITLKELIRENEAAQRERAIDEQDFALLKQGQEELNSLVQPQKEKAQDRASGANFLQQLSGLAQLDPKTRKPQIEALSQEAEQLTGKPFAENTVKTLSSADSEQLKSWMDKAAEIYQKNPNLGLNQIARGLTNPGQFMATITNLNKAANSKKKPGEQVSPGAQSMTRLDRAMTDLNDQIDLELKRRGVFTKMLMKIRDPDRRKSVANGIEMTTQRLQDLSARKRQLESVAFGEPQKLGPGDVLVAGGGPGEQRGIIAQSPTQPRALAETNVIQSPGETALEKKIGEGEGERRQRIFTESLDKARGAQSKLNRIRRTRQLLKDVNVGPGADLRQEFSKVASVLGVDSEDLGRLGIGDKGSAQGLKSLLAQTTLDIALEVPGAISDGDLAIARDITGNMGTTQEGFKAILDTREKIAKQQQKFGKALTEFRKKNPQMEGIDQFIADFQQDNPLFTDKEIEQARNMQPQQPVTSDPQDLEKERQRIRKELEAKGFTVR